MNVPGLCKAASRQEIASTDYSLSPGRYVGLAQITTGDDDGDMFTSRMREIQAELLELNTKATELAEQISENFLELLR